jgi:hypothetical protein
MEMNLYIFKNVLFDYTPGMAVIAASSLERARELFAEEFGFSQSALDEFDEAIKNESYTVLSVVDREEGVVDYVYGGG